MFVCLQLCSSLKVKFNTLQLTFPINNSKSNFLWLNIRYYDVWASTIASFNFWCPSFNSPEFIKCRMLHANSSIWEIEHFCTTLRIINCNPVGWNRNLMGSRYKSLNQFSQNFFFWKLITLKKFTFSLALKYLCGMSRPLGGILNILGFIPISTWLNFKMEHTYSEGN